MLPIDFLTEMNFKKPEVYEFKVVVSIENFSVWYIFTVKTNLSLFFLT